MPAAVFTATNALIREVVDGSLVGFPDVDTNQKLPAKLLAPDGKTDLIFLPKLKNQDADIKKAIGKTQTFETFLGAQRFTGRLIGGKVEGNLRISAIEIAGGTRLSLKTPDNTVNDKRFNHLQIKDGYVAEPRLNEFNVSCDAPGGWGIEYRWKDLNRSLARMFVRTVPWRDYPCQGLTEIPYKASHWRRFTARSDIGVIQSMSDMRDGAFVNITAQDDYAEYAPVKVHPSAYPHYVVRLDSKRNYAPVEMLHPGLMLLDPKLMDPFRQTMQKEYVKLESERVNCGQKIHFKYSRESPEKRSLLQQMECGPYPNSADFVDQRFISTFVPEQQRKLWQH